MGVEVLLIFAFFVWLLVVGVRYPPPANVSGRHSLAQLLFALLVNLLFAAAGAVILAGSGWGLVILAVALGVAPSYRSWTPPGSS